jgi:hypothetical protein
MSTVGWAAHVAHMGEMVGILKKTEVGSLCEDWRVD